MLAEAWVLGGVATSAPDLIGEALRQSGLRPGDIGRLVVGVGPGSYTGIRRAIATLQGWHLALGTPVAPVGSLGLLARLAHERLGRDCELAADAQRGEWACGSMHDGRLMTPLRLRTLEDLRADMARGHCVVTPDEGMEGAMVLHPTAALAAVLGVGLEVQAPESLAPVYLREVAFVKAPQPRPITVT